MNTNERWSPKTRDSYEEEDAQETSPAYNQESQTSPPLPNSKIITIGTTLYYSLQRKIISVGKLKRIPTDDPLSRSPAMGSPQQNILDNLAKKCPLNEDYSYQNDKNSQKN